jgi:trimethylamine--corrinoid protein Co-methyltransferase
VRDRIPIETHHPRIRMLGDEQIHAIHHASLDILSGIGIEVRNEKARQILLDAGAWESADPPTGPEQSLTEGARWSQPTTGGSAERRLMIPPHLVTDAIASAPPRIPLHSRLGELTVPLEEGNVFFGTGSDCLFTVDVATGERRKAVADDVRRVAHLCDGLAQIDFVMSMANPSDVPPLDVYIHEFIGMIRGSVKPCVYTANNHADMADIYRIACAVAGGEAELRERPFLMLYAEPISPLLFPEDSVDNLLFCAEKGIPVAYPPSTNTGGGGPITLAGALALGNAECLAGLVLTQLVRRGSPFLYGMNTSALDMKSAIVSYGAPEWATGMVACCDMARFYGLPAWGAAGATDSKVVDAQAGIEATASIMMAFLSRCNLVHDVGYIEYGATSSMELLVICDEIISEVRSMVNGIEVSDRTLARDAIRRAKPGGGFLADDHTLENWRWAQWRPALLDRTRYDRWVGRGAEDMAGRANARARQILVDHDVPLLSDDAEREIAAVLRNRGAK